MKEVSARVIKAMTEALAAHKAVPVSEVIAHAPYPETFSPGWYTWDSLVDWVEKLNHSPLGPVDWRAVGAECHETPSLIVFQSLWRMTLSIKFAYALACKWLGPSCFSIVVSHYEELSDNRIRLSLELSERARPCPAIFELVEGNLSSASVKIFGLPATEVSCRYSARKAVYLATLPAQLSLWTRLVRAARALMSIKTFRTLLGELVRQQAELHEQSQRISKTQTEFNRLVETFPDGVMIHRQGTIAYINPRMTQYLGYERPDPLIGKSALSVVHEESQELVRERIKAVQSHPLAVTPPQEITFLKNGSLEPFMAEVVALAITWQGKPATLVMARDLTDRKKLQAHLMLTDRMAALGVLAAGVGHEINNPLGYTRLNLEALEKSLKGGDLSRTRQHLDEMAQGLERIRLIVKDLRAFSRAPNERDEYATVPVQVHSVLQSVINMAKNEIEQRAQFRYEPSELLRVNASEAKLGQVFLNLMLNAAQAIPVGKRDQNFITLSTRMDEKKRVVVEIHDTGVGMTDETKNRIYEPFFTTKAAGTGTGTGLGLPISHSIVSSFNGHIEFESTLWKRHHLRVLLPSLEESVNAPRELHTAETGVRSTPDRIRGRVLIIDDDQALLSITQFFISQNHETVALTSARQALELLATGEQFDCILCDLMMPDMNGIEFHRALSELAPHCLPRVLFITGGSFTQESDRFLSRPGIEFVDKPFDTNHLAELIERKVRAVRTETVPHDLETFS